jgi:hypothetical protein
VSKKLLAEERKKKKDKKNNGKLSDLNIAAVAMETKKGGFKKKLDSFHQTL